MRWSSARRSPASPPSGEHGRARTAQQHALDWLRRSIVTGELRPAPARRSGGRRQRIGLSVAPVREALRALEQEGQVTYLPRRGYFVTELRMADLEEIYALRRVLEGGAARAALPAIGPTRCARIEARGGRRARPRRQATSPPSRRQPALSLRDPRGARQPARDADHPRAVGLHGGLPGALLQLARGARPLASRRTSASSTRCARATPTGSSQSSTRTATARSRCCATCSPATRACSRRRRPAPSRS